MTELKPARRPWGPFPDVVILAEIGAVKEHRCYPAAKAGDADAAKSLVADNLTAEGVARIRALTGGRRPTLLSVHAVEGSGVNAIPEALADMLARRLELPVEHTVVQTNVVGHTGATGFARLARQAAFDGDVVPGDDYLLVDDFIGQGGTLANLRGFVEAHGGRVVGAVVLTGKPHSARLALRRDTLAALRGKHGPELEAWWDSRFGHAFDGLTESEARYLHRTPTAHAIRDRIAAEEQAGDRRADPGDP